MQRSYVDHIFLFITKRTMQIIVLFKIAYAALAGVLIWATLAASVQNKWYGAAYEFARQSGEIAVGLYILTCMPGIFRRLGIRHKLISLLMIFRRQIGILMYVFVLIHVMVLRVVPVFLRGGSIFPSSWFEIFGSVASGLLFLLFMTSNDMSVKKLGTWWHKIHQLTYVVMFFILLHVALQAISIWAILTAMLIVVQIISYAVSRSRKVTAAP